MTEKEIQNMATKIRAKDDKHTTVLWKETVITKGEGHKLIEQGSFWIQTGELPKDQVEDFLNRGFRDKPPKGAKFPKDYRIMVKGKWVLASKHFK